MSDARRSLALFVVSAAILFDALDLSITQVALPQIGRELELSAGALQWIPNAYVLTYGGLLLLGGRLADAFGHRRVFVAGLVLFAAMSLAGGLVASGPALIAARALQGAGAALTVPAAVAIVAQTFAEGPARDRALGVFGACASAGFSVGLVLGGVLTDALSWRWVFLVKVPFVLGVAALALWAVEEGRAARAPAGFDVAGALMSVLGVVLLVLAITQLAEPALPVAAIAAAGAAGVALLVAFVVNERRVAAPLLPLRLFAARTVRVTDLASLTVLAAPFGFAFLTTLWMQQVLGFSALSTGLALLPGAALSILTARYLAPALIARFGLRVSAAGTMLLAAAGFLFLLGVATEPRYVTVLLPATLVCLGLGVGTAYPMYTIGSLSGIGEQDQGVAAGVQNTALQIGGGLGLAVVSAAVTASLGPSPSPGELVDALRAGVLAGALFPLLGAAITFAGLASR